MILKHLMELYEILDDPKASGEKVKEYLLQVNPQADVETYPVHGEKGHTDMVRVRVPGKNGKSKGGTAPTIGLLGRLGGIGARQALFRMETEHWQLSAQQQNCYPWQRKETYWKEMFFFPPMFVRMLQLCRINRFRS